MATAAEDARLTLDQAVECARRARGRPSTGWSSRTPAELEVVRLVAEGLANPQIGARLLMSRGTVERISRTSSPTAPQLAAAAIDRRPAPARRSS